MSFLIKIFIVFITMTLAGCAFTAVGTKYDVTHRTSSNINPAQEPIYKEGPDNAPTMSVHFKMSCWHGGRWGTWMISPIIPMPPVLPYYESHEPAEIWLHISGEKFDYNNVELAVSKRNRVFKVDQYKKLEWRLAKDITCMDLNASTIKFTGLKYNEVELELPLINMSVEDQGIKFGVGYLGQ